MNRKATTFIAWPQLRKLSIVSVLLLAAVFMLSGAVGLPDTAAAGERVGTQGYTGHAILLKKASIADQGSLTTDSTPDATALAQALVGSNSGITVSNAKLTCTTGASGIFAGGANIVGLASGVLLTSGNVANVIGPNNTGSMGTNNSAAGDSDLDAISGKTTHDACILEFDFIPTNSVASFQYVFSSEEYKEWVYSPYNDVFAFFVNGENCAIVNGAPVSIDTINNGSTYGPSVDKPPFNQDYFIDNTDTHLNTQMDGLTKVLTCTTKVNPAQSNHIKLAIADASDGNYDSAVFIGGGTFESIKYGFQVDPTSDSKSVLPSSTAKKTATYTVKVSNIGSETDSYTISVGTSTWATNASTKVLGPITSLDSATFDVFVDVPKGTATGQSQLVTITITSQADPTKTATVTLTTKTEDIPYAVDLSPKEAGQGGGAGSTITYTLKITNNGSQSDTFTISTYDVNTSGWTMSANPTSVTLAPGGMDSVDISVTIPTDAKEINYSLGKVIATSGGNTTVTDASLLTTTVLAKNAFAVYPPSDGKTGSAGTSVFYKLQIQNLGGSADSYTLSGVDATGHWWTNPSCTSPCGPVGPGETLDVDVEVGIPENTTNNLSDSIPLTFTSSNDTSLTQKVTLTTTAQVVANGVSVTPPSDFGSQNSGASYDYSIAVTNAGSNTDSYTVAISGKWTTTADVSEINNLDPGATAYITVTVAVPKTSVAGTTDTAVVTVKSKTDTTKSGTSTLTTTALGKSCTFTRDMPTYYIPGIPMTISIDVVPTCVPEDQNFWALQETTPSGWTVSDISDSGAFDAGMITWMNLPVAEQTLTYTITPPSTATGFATFDGLGSISGTDYPTQGDYQMDMNSGYHPADTTQDFKISISEFTALGAAWKTGKKWAGGWNPIQLSFVVNAAYIWKKNAGYHFDSKAGAAPACWVSGPAAGMPSLTEASISKAAANGTAVRSFSSVIYKAGDKLTVTITVTPVSGTTAYAVEDTPPAGMAVSNITSTTTANNKAENGVCSWDSANKKVKCGLFFDDKARVLTYDVAVPAGTTGYINFSGTANFDSNAAAALTGLATIPDKQYTITSSVAGGQGGTISCSSTTALPGTSSTCTVTATTGYALTSLTDNNTDKTASVSSGAYTISNIAADHAVVATFTSTDPCTYTIKAPTYNNKVAAKKGTVKFTVTASAKTCSPVINDNNSDWITPPASLSFNNSKKTATVTLNVTANTSATPRSGSVMIKDASATFNLKQLGVPCTITSATPTGNKNMAATAGTGTIAVTAPAGCGWTAAVVKASDKTWLNVDANSASGTGTGSAQTVTFTVGANASKTKARSGNIKITAAPDKNAGQTGGNSKVIPVSQKKATS